MLPSCQQNSLESIYPVAWRWALARANWDAEIANEAVQNAYVAILEGRVQARTPEYFRSFVLGVIERYIRREQRWQGLRRMLPWTAKTDVRQTQGLSPEIALVSSLPEITQSSFRIKNFVSQLISSGAMRL